MISMKILGIDLGTTNSCMAVMEAGKPIVIPNEEDIRTTSSVVGFSKSGERLVGQMAKKRAILNPQRTVYSIKRFMGRYYDEVESERNTVQYEVVRGPSNSARVKVGDKVYSPQEISAMILRKMKEDAENYLGEKIQKAVITVPAYFNDSQRQATKDAGTIAGLEVVHIISEPTASSLAYGLDKEQDQTILVFDLGGGTFDVSILDIGEGVFEVKATCGDMHLGGDDWDKRVMDWMVEEFRKEHGVDLSKDRMAMQRIKDAAEKAKIELSRLKETNISLPFITANELGPKHLELTLTRAKFEWMTEDLLERMGRALRTAMKDAKLTKASIDKIILVGGSTRMPQVQSFLKEFFGKELHKYVNPEECVAVGAAIQGGVLAGEIRNILLLDVTPLSLGIETLGQVFTRLMEKNTTIPARKSQIFSTATDNQPSVEIHVLQGERSMAYDNHTLGRFILDGIPPAPRGIPQIEVTFDIDINGIMNVTARDLGTGKEQSVRITATTNLSKEEIEKMKAEAEKHAAEDEKRRELIEARNQADILVYTTEKMLKELGDKVVPDEETKVEGALNRLKEVMKGDNLQGIKNAMEMVNTSIHSVSQKMYQHLDNKISKEKDRAAGSFYQSPKKRSSVQNKVFVSYSHQDKDFAMKLSKTLKSAGVQVWMDVEEIKVGDYLIDKIREGLDKASYVIAVISKSSVNSEWVRKELEIAMNQEIEGKKVKVLPVLLDNCDLPGFLKGKCYADFRKKENYYIGCKKIIERVIDSQIYDQFGHEGVRSSFGSGGFQWSDFSHYSDLEDLFGRFFGEDIFGREFGESIFGQKRRGPPRGADIQVDVEISLDDAKRGVEKELRVDRGEKCSKCNGTGAKSEDDLKECTVCRGTGQIQDVSQKGFLRTVNLKTCNTCGGRGKIVKNPCGKCKGSGIITKSRKISIRIPPGVESGTRFRMGGEGEIGPGGPGDLFVVVHVKPHPFS